MPGLFFGLRLGVFRWVTGRFDISELISKTPDLSFLNHGIIVALGFAKEQGLESGHVLGFDRG